MGSEREKSAPVVNVRIPPVLHDAVGGVRQLEVEGATVSEALDDLFARFPALRDRLTKDGQLSPFLNVYVNADDVRQRDGLATVVRDADTSSCCPRWPADPGPSALWRIDLVPGRLDEARRRGDGGGATQRTDTLFVRRSTGGRERVIACQLRIVGVRDPPRA